MQWWLVLALSLTSGTVVSASLDTWILTTSYGTNLVHLFRATKGFYYEIVREDSSTVKAKITLENGEVNWTPGYYIINNCTQYTHGCVDIITNALSLRFRADNLFGPINIGVTITLSSFTANETIGNCFEFRDDEHWFGGPQGNYQRWPVQDSIWDFTSYIPKKDNGMAIAEPYWFNTGGDHIYVTPTSLFFEQRSGGSNNSICLSTSNVSPYKWRNETLLQYQVFHWQPLALTHTILVRELFPIPTGAPERRKAIYPTWSTGIRYGDNVNDALLRVYAEEIFANEYNNSMIEIDGGWESCYGSLTFNNHSSKFPDIQSLTDFIHDLGFRVSLSVHPFINSDCEEYQIAKDLGYFVENEDGDVTTSWWRGDNASLIDFTNEDAAKWFTSRLIELKNSSGIDSFKFEAGEPSWAPEPAVLTSSIEKSPGIYTTQFAKAAAELGNDTEVGTGWLSQDLPLYVRMPKKDATWDSENGLASLIPTLLTMNMAGYGFVVPDIMTGADSTNHPSKELLIRWIEATTFMPSVKHSFVPWDYDNETIQIIRHFTEFRESISHHIIAAMDAWVSSTTRRPVNAPVWFVQNSNDSEAYQISDEYLLGAYFLIAPVLEEGARSRDIYLPPGTWHDVSQEPTKIIEGPVWIYNYTAPLNVLPYFIEDAYYDTEESENGSFHVSSNVIAIFATTILCLVATLYT